MFEESKKQATCEEIKKYLLLLFENPQEPTFVPLDKKAVFNVPHHFLTDEYKSLAKSLPKGSDENEVIPVECSISLPLLGEITSLGRQETFSLFIPKHNRIASQLIHLLSKYEALKDFLACCVYVRERVNPYLFNYCLAVCMLHREDTKDLNVPPLVHSFPDKFLERSIIPKARESATLFPTDLRKPIEMERDYTANDFENENRVAYFREDIGINLHHWHWHLIYPTEGPIEMVKKNRRGELFYYMHQQIIARYNFERFCNKLPRVERLSNLREPVKEAYFPKLNCSVSKRNYPGRVANQTIQNLNRANIQIHHDIDDMERWRNRIYEAIHQGYVRTEDGQRLHLTETGGIDVLGDIIEASILSPNKLFYGNYHNMGHLFLAFIHDPDHRHLEGVGVLGDNTTAMRDPVFYRWHAHIDDIFQEYKSTLPAYKVDQLDFKGITVTRIEILSEDTQTNKINTFWQKSDVDLSSGMDFQKKGSVYVRLTHLQHQCFKYKIHVNNTEEHKKGTCRIFLAPKYDESNNLWQLDDQKNFFIELDKFVVCLRKGQNVITRLSIESSVTIPFERTFTKNTKDKNNFCGCGWPDHMLIPKGTTEGYQCQLFVMISDHINDHVEQDISGACDDAVSFCGLKNKLYPDLRPMGFPFDRKPRKCVKTLEDFLTPNMGVQDITIQHSNHTTCPRRY